MAVFLVSAFNLPLVDPPVFALFELQIGSPTYIPDERGCEHMGVGGKVYDLQGAPIVGLAVRMGRICYQAPEPIRMTTLGAPVEWKGFLHSPSHYPNASLSGQRWLCSW